MGDKSTRNEGVRSQTDIACCHAVPSGMVEPGMVVVRRMGRITRQSPPLVIEQDERQGQRQGQIRQQRADQEEPMQTRLYHNVITAFPYAPRACGRRGNTF